MLTARHHITDPLKRDFTVTAQQSLLSKFHQLLLGVALFVVGAASVSLVVGAVGIANVMLVSVTERTTEIGIRRAVGARRHEITRQFLIESGVLAGMGGLCGVVVGVTMTLLASVVVPLIAPRFGTPQISPSAALLAFIISVLIGVAAGIYPARRAAQLHPIQALRY